MVSAAIDLTATWLRANRTGRQNSQSTGTADESVDTAKRSPGPFPTFQKLEYCRRRPTQSTLTKMKNFETLSGAAFMKMEPQEIAALSRDEQVPQEFE